MFIYKSTLEGIFTVGFYDPCSRFVAESDHTEKSDAVRRVHYLNGGINADLIVESVNHVCSLLAELNNVIMDAMLEKSRD